MFGFLKEKLKNAVKSISERFEKKEDEIKKFEEAKKEIEQKIEAVEEKPVEKVLEEVRPIIEEKAPEMKEEVEKAVEEVKEEVKAEVKRIEKPKEKKSFFKKVTEKIIKKVTEKKLSDEDLEPILKELESGLIEADVAYEVVKKIKNDLKKSLVDREIKRGKEKDIIINALKKSLLEILSVPEINLEELIKKARSENRPTILLFFGFNGSGKTTSIAKIARWLIDRNYTVALAAADTWRKAAIEQLEEHGKKLGVTTIKHKYGADPAAIVYDGVEHCKSKGINVLLGDTAGRTHVNKNLIDELKKIIRVNKPDLKILVMDSLVGNDAVQQSQIFNNAVGIDAVMFTKNDVNPRGGAILSVSYLLKKPILFLGIGQNHSDIVEFNSSKFVEQLLHE